MGRHKFLFPPKSVVATTFTVTTAGAESITFDELDVAVGESLTVWWGDGNSDVLTGEGTNVSHAYAGAGTWTVRISNPTIITRLNCDDSKFGCEAGFIGSLTALTSLSLNSLANVTVGSGEIGSLTALTYLYLYNLANVTVGSGEIGGLTSLTSLSLLTIPNVTVGSGEIGSLTSLTSLRLSNLANVTVGSGEIGSLTSLTYLRLNSLANCALQTSYPTALTTITYQNSLSQANVDDVLFGIYTMTVTPRTGSNGTVDVAGTNAAPSGIFQAAAACPVDGSTPGKEVAHELLNDGCGVGFNAWATVTTTA